MHGFSIVGVKSVEPVMITINYINTFIHSKDRRSCSVHNGNMFLKSLKNKAISRIFESQTEGVKRGWRQLHNQLIIMVTTPKRMKSVGHAAAREK